MAPKGGGGGKGYGGKGKGYGGKGWGKGKGKKGGGKLVYGLDLMGSDYADQKVIGEAINFGAAIHGEVKRLRLLPIAPYVGRSAPDRHQ